MLIDVADNDFQRFWLVIEAWTVIFCDCGTPLQSVKSITLIRFTLIRFPRSGQLQEAFDVVLSKVQLSRVRKTNTRFSSSGQFQKTISTHMHRNLRPTNLRKSLRDTIVEC